MNETKMYQVSTLQALSLGYTRPVIDVSELITHGDIGLGTFEAVDGEMIVIDGQCYRAKADGNALIADSDMGVPFASVCRFHGQRHFEIGEIPDIETLKKELNNRIEMHFGLNSMHMLRIDADFISVSARSESPFAAVHVLLKDMLGETQRSFRFDNITGSLVCVYYPDYMNGINAYGWHFHFISTDRTKGGHVFDLNMKRGTVAFDQISKIEIQLPADPMFDTYSLANASEKDIKAVEQGK